MRIPRVFWLAGVLLLIVYFAVSSSAYEHRAVTNPVCLSYGKQNLVDITTGALVVDRRAQALANAGPRAQLPSPNQRYDLHVLSVLGGLYDYQVVSLTAPSTPPITIEQGADSSYVNWMGGSRLAYVRRMPDGTLRGSVVALTESGDPGIALRMDAPVAAPERSRHWSPDGNYFVLELVNQPYLMLWSVREKTVTMLPTKGPIIAFDWPSQGPYFAYTQGDLRGTWLTFATSTGEVRTFEIPAIDTSSKITWSRDGRYLVLMTAPQYPISQLGVYGVDGLAKPGLANIMFNANETSVISSVWLPDGSLAYMTNPIITNDPHSEYQWRRFRPDTQAVEILVPTFSIRPYFQDGSNLMRVAFLQQHQDKTFSLLIMNTDGTHQTEIVRGADAINAPDWSPDVPPDTRYVAAIWSTGNASSRRYSVTWAQADGSNPQTVSNGFEDVNSLLWGSNVLTFLVHRSVSLESVERVNLKTGALSTLDSGFSRVNILIQQADITSFWWQQQDGLTGADGYRIDGTRVFRFVLPRGKTYSIDGRAMTQYYLSYFSPGSPQFYRAPGSGIGLLRLGPLPNESLYLAAPDGTRSNLLFADVSIQNDPIWSPDGKYAAVLLASAKGGPSILSVVDSSGNPVYHLTENESQRYLGPVAVFGNFLGFRWTNCLPGA